ncbi:hypothetical protein G7046_g9114 [Stylonectria norvegica]|nr:hypothetical protein G7046_g9114 [Stylonectria norvegica]
MSLPYSHHSPHVATSHPDGEKEAPATVQIHALSAGHFTIPEEQFVAPSTREARKQVPSLSFLIQHDCPVTGETTRIVFDLGLRRDPDRYSEPIRHHIATREPYSTEVDVVKSLKAGGLTPNDIDYVLLSHVHWDHVGEPRDFPHSSFVVGHGSLDLLHGKSNTSRGGHSFFEADLLDPARTIELSDPTFRGGGLATPPPSSASPIDFNGTWKSLDNLPSVLDLFQDGSLYIVDAPGHLAGHVNLLIRTSNGFIYLAGDACHDRRIIRKEKEIGEWYDPHGYRCCIHTDRAKAEETLERIRELEESGVEVIFAHDVEWENDDLALSAMTSSQDKKELQKRFEDSLGPDAFHSGWKSLLALDPPFFAASLSLASVPRQKSLLSHKDQALIGLAVDAAATHLYVPGIRAHIAAAKKEGATVEEVLEVIELSSTLGIHACNIGVPLLVEVLKEEGKYLDDITKPFDDRQKNLQAEFTEKRGYWHTFWEDFLRLDPEFFGAYLEFSSVPWTKDIGDGNNKGALSPKLKELVYCAFDCAATHLYVPGLKLHMKNVLGYGGTPQEILEVLEIATQLSVHTAHVSAPIIEELFKAQK